MADVTIVLFNGSHWLVAGDHHLDSLLRGDEPSDIQIDFVEVRSWAELSALREGPDEAPWQINPKIIVRLKERHLRVTE